MNVWRISTDFTKIIVKHLHFLHRENETKLYVRKIFFSAQTKGAFNNQKQCSSIMTSLLHWMLIVLPASSVWYKPSEVATTSSPLLVLTTSWIPPMLPRGMTRCCCSSVSNTTMPALLQQHQSCWLMTRNVLAANVSFVSAHFVQVFRVKELSAASTVRPV